MQAQLLTWITLLAFFFVIFTYRKNAQQGWTCFSESLCSLQAVGKMTARFRQWYWWGNKWWKLKKLSQHCFAGLHSLENCICNDESVKTGNDNPLHNVMCTPTCDGQRNHLFIKTECNNIARCCFAQYGTLSCALLASCRMHWCINTLTGVRDEVIAQATWCF